MQTRSVVSIAAVAMFVAVLAVATPVYAHAELTNAQGGAESVAAIQIAEKEREANALATNAMAAEKATVAFQAAVAKAASLKLAAAKSGDANLMGKAPTKVVAAKAKAAFAKVNTPSVKGSLFRMRSLRGSSDKVSDYDLPLDDDEKLADEPKPRPGHTRR